jgi:hypothetical protein
VRGINQEQSLDLSETSNISANEQSIDSHEKSGATTQMKETESLRSRQDIL